MTHFSDLEQDLQAYILQPEEFESWAVALEGRVVPWIREQGNKGLWDVVSFVSQRMGILQWRLARGKFAKLVVRVCPSLRGDSPKALRSCMEKGGNNYSSMDKKYYERLPETKWLKKYGIIIEGLLRGEDNANTMKSLSVLSDLTNRMEVTLRTTLTEAEHAPCSRLRTRRVYQKDDEHSIQPSLSIENYSSDDFLVAERPSYIVAYECLDKLVTREDVKNLWYDYAAFRAVKLVIVSTQGFAADVISSAGNNGIALVRVKANGEISHVLPHSQNDYLAFGRQKQSLAGGEMEGQLLLWDSHAFHSLAAWLTRLCIPVRKNTLPCVPYHPDEEILKLIDSLQPLLFLKGEFEVRGMLHIAQREGINIEWADLPEVQLGRLDVAKRTISLSNSIKDDAHRSRFTLAHELGHYFLHAEALRSFFTSYGETEASLMGKYDDGDAMHRLEYQANYFASELLMPVKHVQMLAARFFNERERRMGYLWYDDQRDSWKRYNYVVSNMSIAMNVSKTAVRLRMKKLGLLREVSSFKRLSEIM